LNYHINEHLKLQGVFNLLERYTEEKIFIPGKNLNAILPQYYGIGENTVRKGIAKSDSRYFGLDATYNRTFDRVHQLKVMAGSRTISSSFEYDMATGYNTANDFYKTLDKTAQENWINGMNSEWKWVNNYLYVGYTYKDIVSVDFNASLDASSVSGADAKRFYAYPSVGLTYMLTHWEFMPELIDQLNIRAEYATSGNSRFSSNYGMNYYHSANLFSIGTVGRADVPNTAVRPEQNEQVNVGLDLAMLRKRVNLGLDVYRSKASNLLFAGDISRVYHSENYLENTAAISGHGVEISLRADIIQTKDFVWTFGGSVSSAKSKIDKLGGQDEVLLKFEEYGDDVHLLMKVGKTPYQFYGYKTEDVYNSAQQAVDADLTNIKGGKYQAGDVRFVNQNEDAVINEEDKVVLGSAMPDYFGNLFTNFEYKGFQLQINLSYSAGNYAYNAVRREIESMENFYNQSTAVLNRWQYDGQITDMPRAVYGDPSGNNIFSDRWVEDASYLKLSSVVLGYRINRPFFGMFRSANVWISGENLYTFTKYLGIDPEFAYSYDDRMLGFDYGKASIPRSVRIGFNLNF
jgi:hypothetical protein